MSADLVVVDGFDASAAANPQVDLVIAVHDLSRPVGRAVASALTSDLGETRQGSVRVTVACHELAAAEVAALLPPETRSCTRLLEVRDGLGSPSGPFNAGIDLADAPFVAIMGSDDILEPGALLAWYDRAQASGADVVLARMRMQDGKAVNTPRVRPGRTHDLDPVADRLAYRTAPIGLLRRSMVERFGLRLDAGMPNGGDLAFGIRLWEVADKVDLAADAPAYVIGLDARTRVTTTVRPLGVELVSQLSLVTQPWFRNLAEPYRRAVAIKVLRIHLLGAITRRAIPEAWADGELDLLRGLVTDLVGCAPHVLRPFSRADRVVFDACLDPVTTPASMVAAVTARANSSRWEKYLTRRLFAIFDRESTLRYTIANVFWTTRG